MVDIILNISFPWMWPILNGRGRVPISMDVAGFLISMDVAHGFVLSALQAGEQDSLISL